jgi:hypothetical protein
MKPTHKFAIALAAGVSLGAVGIEGLSAQSRPPTYFIVDISEITDRRLQGARSQSHP